MRGARSRTPAPSRRAPLSGVIQSSIATRSGQRRGASTSSLACGGATRGNRSVLVAAATREFVGALVERMTRVSLDPKPSDGVGARAPHRAAARDPRSSPAAWPPSASRAPSIPRAIRSRLVEDIGCRCEARRCTGVSAPPKRRSRRTASMRLFVVRGSPPQMSRSCVPLMRSAPQPPGPGLPLQAPSV